MTLSCEIEWLWPGLKDYPNIHVEHLWCIIINQYYTTVSNRTIVVTLRCKSLSLYHLSITLSYLPPYHDIITANHNMCCYTTLFHPQCRVICKNRTCSGWALNKMPQLKSFLKNGEAESYRNVEVKFISGRKAVMTVYEGISKDNWVESESIVLSEYQTKVWYCIICMFIYNV